MFLVICRADRNRRPSCSIHGKIDNHGIGFSFFDAEHRLILEIGWAGERFFPAVAQGSLPIGIAVVVIRL